MDFHHHAKATEKKDIMNGIIFGYTVSLASAARRYLVFKPRKSKNVWLVNNTTNINVYSDGYDSLKLAGAKFELLPNSVFMMILGKFQDCYTHSLQQEAFGTGIGDENEVIDTVHTVWVWQM